MNVSDRETGLVSVMNACDRVKGDTVRVGMPLRLSEDWCWVSQTANYSKDNAYYSTVLTVRNG